MPICKKCSKQFPNRYIDDSGKLHNCQRRKYCLECSTFGKHNTSKLEIISLDNNGNRVCKKCGKSFTSKRRHVCETCNNKTQRGNKKRFLMSMVGNKCWRCGYGGEEKYIPLLDMHHVEPDKKLFPLTSTDIASKSKDEIVEEAKKCVLLCNRCHMEYHYTDDISDEEIKELHKKWIDIKL